MVIPMFASRSPYGVSGPEIISEISDLSHPPSVMVRVALRIPNPSGPRRVSSGVRTTSELSASVTFSANQASKATWSKSRSFPSRRAPGMPFCRQRLRTNCPVTHNTAATSETFRDSRTPVRHNYGVDEPGGVSDAWLGKSPCRISA